MSWKARVVEVLDPDVRGTRNVRVNVFVFDDTWPVPEDPAPDDPTVEGSPFGLPLESLRFWVDLAHDWTPERCQEEIAAVARRAIAAYQPNQSAAGEHVGGEVTL